MVDRLDIKVRTPTPAASPSINAEPLVTQTPHAPMEVIAQASFMNNSINYHQESSLTPYFSSTKRMAEEMMEMAHEMTLMSAELRNLRAANDALRKCSRAKKTRLCRGGTLTQAEGSQIVSEYDTGVQIKRDKGRNGGSENW